MKLDSMRSKLEETVTSEHKVKSENLELKKWLQATEEKSQILEEKLIEVKTQFAEDMHKYEIERN